MDSFGRRPRNGPSEAQRTWRLLRQAALRYLPDQVTSIPNLLLAGAHTRTAADVWSIEGAVESGRRAAQAIDPRVKVLPQYKPLWLRILSAIDDGFFAVGLPHVLDLLLGGFLLAAAAGLGLWIYHL